MKNRLFEIGEANVDHYKIIDSYKEYDNVIYTFETEDNDTYDIEFICDSMGHYSLAFHKSNLSHPYEDTNKHRFYKIMSTVMHTVGLFLDKENVKTLMVYPIKTNTHQDTRFKIFLQYAETYIEENNLPYKIEIDAYEYERTPSNIFTIKHIDYVEDELPLKYSDEYWNQYPDMKDMKLENLLH